jgi:hypothetical protein
MFGVQSFFVADDTGANQSTFTRHPTLPGVWQLGAINLTIDQMIATADAINKSLSQPLAPSYATAYNTGVGSPALNFNPGNVADIADDTVAIGATSSWSRSKGMAFIAAVNAFVAV